MNVERAPFDVPSGWVCAQLAEEARRRYAEAAELLADCDSRQMRPAIIMMEVYRRVLDRLIARGWRRLGQPVGLSKGEKLWIALRYGYL